MDKINQTYWDFDLKDPNSVRIAHFFMKPTQINEEEPITMDFHTFLKTHPTRQTLLRYLLIDSPGVQLKRQVSVSELARRMKVSRNAISRLLNSDPKDLPLSEQMSIRCYLLVKDLALKNSSSEKFELDDWLDIDLYYRREEIEQRLEDYVAQFKSEIEAFSCPVAEADKSVNIPPTVAASVHMKETS